MSMESPPWALSGGTATYPAEQTRRAMFAWAARTAANSPGIIAGGLLSPTDMQLSAASSGLVVNISAGECLIGGTEGGVQGGYYARNASTSSVTLATANATNPRIDAVVGMVGDAGYTLPSGATSGQVTLVGVTGTPTAGATLSNLNGAPAVPASSLLLGYVLVPAAATSLSSGDIANVAERVQQSPGLNAVSAQTPSTFTAANGWNVIPASSNIVGSSFNSSGAYQIPVTGSYLVAVAGAMSTAVIGSGLGVGYGSSSTGSATPPSRALSDAISAAGGFPVIDVFVAGQYINASLFNPGSAGSAYGAISVMRVG